MVLSELPLKKLLTFYRYLVMTEADILSLWWPDLAITIALRAWNGRRRHPAVVDHVRVKSNNSTLGIHLVNHLWTARIDKKKVYLIK